MNELIQFDGLSETFGLKKQLDEIDEIVKGATYDGYYWSRLNILMGMWEKGKVIVSFLGGVKPTPSFRELERLTGRGDDALKKWHDLYRKYSDKDAYIEIAKEKATAWTDKAFKKELPEPETPLLPSDLYRVVYADPPWKYSDELIKNDAFFTTYGSATHHYPVMTIEKLCELDVKSIVDKNSVLFLWITSPLLDDCWPIIKAWGFEYKTSFVWDKIKHNYGHYNSVRHEILLVCTRGRCLPDEKKLYDSVQQIERTEKHSEKPQKFREIIDTLYTKGKKIELFAREKHEGWDAWGDEVL